MDNVRARQSHDSVSADIRKAGSSTISQGALPAVAFYAKLGRLGWFVYCELEYQYGISTFDSESFELELNGRAWDTYCSSFRSHGISVCGFGRISITGHQVSPSKLHVRCRCHVLAM